MRVVWLRGFVVVLCLYSAIGSRSSYVLSVREGSSKIKEFAITESQTVVSTLSAICVSWRLQYGVSVV